MWRCPRYTRDNNCR